MAYMKKIKIHSLVCARAGPKGIKNRNIFCGNVKSNC